AVAVEPAVVLRNVVADHVAGGRPGAGVLADQKAGAVVVMGVVVLHDRIGDAAVEVKAVAVGGVGVRHTAVVVGLVVVDGDAVGVVGPDADYATEVAAVIVGDRAFDGAAVGVGDHQAVADVVIGRAVADVDVAVRGRRGLPPDEVASPA